MTDRLADLTRDLIAFRDERDWKKFHTLKDLILSVGIEAGELMELAQWIDTAELEARTTDPAFRQRLSEEVSDVFLYLLLICEKMGVDPIDAALHKIAMNRRKYPPEKARGRAVKYTDL